MNFSREVLMFASILPYIPESETVAMTKTLRHDPTERWSIAKEMQTSLH